MKEITYRMLKAISIAIINGDPKMTDLSGLKPIVEKLESLVVKNMKSSNSFY